MITRKNTIPDTGAFTGPAQTIYTIAQTEGLPVSVPDSLLFFDIETTGLSPDTSFLYLIGCMFLEDGQVTVEQFFSEGIEEEALLIGEFDALLERHPVPVHFNGQTFDIPYIAKKRASLGIPEPDAAAPGFDIFRHLKTYKAFFGSRSMSQKALEAYCGIRRKDMYDGGQLISVYNMYLAKCRLEQLHENTAAPYRPVPGTGLTTAVPETSAELLELLMLHNYEDVTNMLPVSQLLSLPALLAGGYDIEGTEAAADRLYITLLPHDRLLAAAFRTGHTCLCAPECTIEAKLTDCRLVFAVPVFNEELKLFYPDHKNYYYLPAEDNAVHKSIGGFLDKSLRTPCRAENCYTRHSLDFVPMPGRIGKHEEYPFKVFRRGHADVFGYISAKELLASEELISAYVRLLLANLI